MLRSQIASSGAAIIAFGTWTITLVSICLAAHRIGRRKSWPPASGSPPPVTIVRPLCGRERFSEETLRSGFVLDYRDYELVFCVASSADPVISLVEEIMVEHPEVAARVMVGDDRVSENPKLNNCIKGWEAARHDWVVLADSNVLMPPDYIARLLSAWRPDTGVVCSTPIGVRPDGFWALVECAFLNTLQARWQYAGEAMGHGFTQGKSMLWNASFLNGKGGLRALGTEIAEDAAATKLVRQAGLRVHLVDEPFAQPLGRRRMGEIWARQFRWARLRRVTFPLFFAPEVLSSPVFPVIAIAFWAGWGSASLALTGLLLASWYGSEALLARRAGWHLSPAMLAAFLVRDILVLTIWVGALVGRDVVWRGNAMRIGTHGAAKLAPADALNAEHERLSQR